MNKVDMRITMADIARRAGVARSTVSRALRDDPTIPLKRCEEIKRLAEEAGYRPNPLVSTLMAQLHKRRRRDDPNCIAWIDLWPARAQPPTVVMVKPVLRGAVARAGELGFEIEVHPVGSVPLHPERLRQILLARSQWGFIIPAVPQHAKTFPIDMRGLIGVTIGTSLLEPKLHRVTTNHFQSVKVAWQALRAKCFQRIALALSPAINERLDGQWLGGYLAAQFTSALDASIPPLLVSEAEYPRFETWFREYRPDAMLLAEPFVAKWSQTLGDQCRARPAIAWLALEPNAKDVWGLDYQAELIGAAAVDMVVAQIHRNERGSPAHPHTLLLDSVWTEK
ncbi:MAG TPA: LacI family DNA-binding transcriptional regulator [Opitutaceae bacterium]